MTDYALQRKFFPLPIDAREGARPILVALYQGTTDATVVLAVHISVPAVNREALIDGS